MPVLNIEDKDLFMKLKKQLMMLDPVSFCENHLTLDGKPFRLSGNGYKPFGEIYRYIGIKALEPDSKPVIIVKGRQVGATTMASALEMYFMGSGIFGIADKPPIRVIHAFPQLELAAAYSKTKLNQIISSAIPVPADPNNKAAKQKSCMQVLLDQSTATNDSLHFKQFTGGNHLWVESVGLDGDRIMGRTADILFFDECFPSNQKIATNKGKKTIGSLVKNHLNNKDNPLILSFNENTQSFEYKKIINAWEREKKELIRLFLCGKKIDCTPNHKFLTEFGWQEAKNIKSGTLIKTYHDTDRHISSLNNDQYQIILGSFLGDGHVNSEGQSRYRLKVIHGSSQKDYCNWKANAFNSNIKYIKENGYAKKEAYSFQTKLFGLNKKFPKTKNDCPQWILDDIDARGIAIWFMDDGSITRKWNSGMSGTISTCSFNEDSQKRFVKKFKDLNIECHYKKYDGQFYLLFNKNGFNNLFKLIEPYMHENLLYKTHMKENNYKWNFIQNKFGWLILDKIVNTNISKKVYDIEIENNHNFILSPNTYGHNLGGPIAHNCQKTTSTAIGNSLKVLTTAKYGRPSKGVQIYFGTPRRKGSDFHKMWQTSSQQYYYLGCENCEKHFPLYTPGSDDWKKIWIYGKIVRCPHCTHEQDKLEAAERGKWISFKDPNDPDCQMIGFHINQLYMPMFTREDIDNEIPGKHPINTERVFMNEVLGEFFQGDSSPITPEEIKEKCADVGRKFSGRITPVINSADPQMVILGIDYGARADLEQLANPEKIRASGQSYSTAVVLSVKGPNLLSIEFATKFKRNDMESKKGIIDQIMRQYSVQLAVGDIGYSNDFSSLLHQIYGDKYLVSRAHNKVNGHVKFTTDAFPKEIVFERDFYIGELYEQMKNGMIRFPYGDYEKVAWLIDHCCSMEIKPSTSRIGGDPEIHYVKGGTPNDGFMALLNAYIAYKFLITRGFTNNNPLLQQSNFSNHNKPLVLSGFIPRKF
jgi:intein/homing endonuclease